MFIVVRLTSSASFFETICRQARLGGRYKTTSDIILLLLLLRVDGDDLLRIILTTASRYYTI